MRSGGPGGLMGGTGGRGMAMSAEMMGRRMDMVEMMTQMMADRDATNPPAAAK